MMQKIFFITLILIGFMFACEPYEEYKGDNEFTTAYFPYQRPVRQLVVGEGIDFHIGVAMGGRRANTQEEWVRFEIDESLVEGTPMKALPRSYYTLSETSQVTIPSGEFRGLIKVTLDSASFVSDDSSYYQHYVIPLKITETSLDSVLFEKDYTMFGVKAYNPFHAVYYHTGMEILDSAGSIYDTNVFSREVFSNNTIWQVYSNSYTGLTTNGLGRYLTSNQSTYRFNLSIENSEVEVHSHDSSFFEVTDLGGSSYNTDNRSFFLNYTYNDTVIIDDEYIFNTEDPPVAIDTIFGYNVPVVKRVYDTLIFRNVPLFVEEWEMPEEE